MEFDFDIGRALGAPAPPKVCDGSRVHRVDSTALCHQRWGEKLRELLDKVGERSRRAQGLGKAVTFGHAAAFSGDGRVYLLACGCTCLGLLKVGPKRLFVSPGEKSGLVEISPLCVLDFYIVEGSQRVGLGRRLFQAMLAREGTSADRLAYDRPSPKLVGFMRKHYGLARYNPQANNFVVFDAYFSANHTRRPSETNAKAIGTARGRAPSAPAAPARASRPDSKEAYARPSSESHADSLLADEDVLSLLTVKPANLDPPKGLVSATQELKRPPVPCRPPRSRDAGYAASATRAVQAPAHARNGTSTVASKSSGSSARSASPLRQAGRNAVKPSPLVQAMAQGLVV